MIAAVHKHDSEGCKSRMRRPTPPWEGLSPHYFAIETIVDDQDVHAYLAGSRMMFAWELTSYLDEIVSIDTCLDD